MKKGARVVIVEDGKILFIHRIKYGKEYYVLPGGAIEEGESPEQAAVREIKEETSFDIELDKLLWQFEETVKEEVRLGYYFLCTEFKGNLELGGPELEIQSEDNKYIFEWIPISDIDKYFIYPAGLKERIKKAF
ncbi:NUDIX domain-containing protein [Thermoproteota archaeon]